jgi:biopolymer transport protein ExbD
VQRRRKAPQDEVGFNITPMIDMTFLLLIFFMVTTKITNEQVKKDIALPTAISRTGM